MNHETDAILHSNVIYQPTVSFVTTGSFSSDLVNLEPLGDSTLEESAFSIPSSMASIPRTSASEAYFFGDSQTKGSNAAVGVYYTDGAGNLLQKFRWTNMFCENYENSLVENLLLVVSALDTILLDMSILFSINSEISAHFLLA